MNIKKLTPEFLNLCIFSGVTGVILAIISQFALVSPELDLGLNVLIAICFVIMSLKDANGRKAENKVFASGWWSLLGMAYPIAVSFKEKSWNSVLWYLVIAIAIPMIVVFALVFALTLMGIGV